MLAVPFPCPGKDSCTFPLTSQYSLYYVLCMKTYTTVQVAKLLHVGRDTIYRWMRAKKITAAKVTRFGSFQVRLWTVRDVAAIRHYMEQNPYKGRGKKRSKA
jgi:excisionase family DNA binding protein